VSTSSTRRCATVVAITWVITSAVACQRSPSPTIIVPPAFHGKVLIRCQHTGHEFVQILVDDKGNGYSVICPAETVVFQKGILIHPVNIERVKTGEPGEGLSFIVP
jgi:hypothetical protein